MASRRKQISYDEFWERHERGWGKELDFLIPPLRGMQRTTLAEGLSAPIQKRVLPPLMEQLRKHPLIDVLRAASQENCPEAFYNLVLLWFVSLDVRPPVSVLVPPKGTPGRPKQEQTVRIYNIWNELGRPPLSKKKLAFAVYGQEFTKAGSAERKRMVDRCRRAVERHNAQLEA